MKDKKQSQPNSDAHKVRKNEADVSDNEPVTEASPDTGKPIEIGDDPDGTKRKIPQMKK